MHHNIKIALDPQTQNGFNNSSDLHRRCRQHMAENGLPFDGELQPDGRIHRFSADAKKRQPDEWYVAFQGVSERGNPYLICTYASWSRGNEKHIFRSWDDGQVFGDEERIALHLALRRRQDETESLLREEADKSAIQADQIWNEAHLTPPDPSYSAYAKAKGVEPIGARFCKNPSGFPCLVIPIRNIEDEIRSLQFISWNHKQKKSYKNFLSGGQILGNFLILGEIDDKSSIYVAEGYATGVSVYAATGSPVVVAFTSNNLEPVVANLRKKFPKNSIVISADDDKHRPGNPGRAKAEEAAIKHSCFVIIPKFPNDFRLPNGEKPNDFNDLHVHFGIDEAKKQLSVRRERYLKPINIFDFLSLELPERKLILDPWLPEEGLAMIYSKRGLGKTLVALSIGYAIASGGKVLNWSAPESKRVLFIDGEMPASQMKTRLAAIVKGSDKQIPDHSYFKILNDYLKKDSSIRDLATLQGQNDINDHLDDFDVLILDNISTLVRSGFENEAESWLTIQSWALSLRKAGKSVIFIHHANKSGGSRGSSRREDVLDTVINLRHPPNYSPSTGAQFELHFEKSRGFAGPSADPFQATLIEMKDGSIRWECQELEGRDLDRLVDLYNDGLTKQRDLAQELGISLGQANKLVKEAKKQRLIPDD